MFKIMIPTVYKGISKNGYFVTFMYSLRGDQSEDGPDVHLWVKNDPSMLDILYPTYS